MGEIDDDTGEKAGFRHPEQEASQIELAGRVHGRHEDGDQPPSDQDSRDPLTSAPTLHDQRTRYFKKEISDGEDAGAEAKNAIAEVQVAGHLQTRIAHIDAIQKGDDVQNEKERQQAAGDAPRSAL